MKNVLIPDNRRMSSLPSNSSHSLLSSSLSLLITSSYPCRSGALCERTNFTSELNSKAWLVCVDISITLLTTASCSWSGGEQALHFHLWTTIKVGSDTASGGNVRWTAPSLRSQRAPSLVIVPLKDKLQKRHIMSHVYELREHEQLETSL